MPSPLLAAETATVASALQPVLLVVFAAVLGYALLAIAELRRQVADLKAAAQARPAVPSTSPAAAPAPVAAAVKPAVADGALSPQLMAVIAAAIRHTLGDTRHRIVSFTKAATPEADGHSLWSVEGRREVFHSHVVR